MGHSLAEVIVPSGVSNRINEVISRGVREWCDNPDNDRGDPRAGYGFVAPTMTEKNIEFYISANTEKIFQNSVVIPLVANSDVKVTTKKVKLTVSGETLIALQSDNWGGRSAVFNAIYKEHGVFVTEVATPKLPKPKKAVASATEGKAVTKYMIVTVRSDNWGGQIVAKDFDSQAAARAEAIRLVNSETPKEKHYSNLEIQAYVVRDTNNRALVVIGRPVQENTEIDVVVTFTTPKPNAKVVNYCVAFDYHH